MTLLQLEPSAHAPCTKTTLGYDDSETLLDCDWALTVINPAKKTIAAMDKRQFNVIRLQNPLLMDLPSILRDHDIYIYGKYISKSS
jgi:hypothetical protein